MVNCMPVFIAREPYWQRRFEEAGVPIIGDDIKSQVGATISHRVLTTLFRDRGVHLDRTMQLNVGGNSDFLNMLERDRLESKKISKTNAVTSMLDYDLGAGNVHVGPSDYVPWLTDRKWAYIRMEGKAFGDVPLNLELKLEVWDSPNSAGIVIDAVRLAKLALNNGVAGALEAPELVPDEVAAEADPRRRGAREHRALHRAARAEAEDEGRREGVDASDRGRPRSGSVPLDCGDADLPVTPFAWSVPHDVNDHVAGVAAELRELGHSVTVLAPSSRAADLLAGRQSLLGDADDDVIAIGPAVPISRRSSMGVPVGWRANLAVALSRGGYDVVHGFEPGLPSLSYLALRYAHTIAVASFFSPERLGYPPAKAQRAKLLGRIDALVASSEEVAAAAGERFPGDYRIVSPGVDTDLFRPGRKRQRSCSNGAVSNVRWHAA